jgi:hypothetical protein
MIQEFRARCVERGVPVEAILTVDPNRAKVVRAIGNGSSAARSALMGQILQLSGNFDPQGRQQVVRDMVRTLAGVEAADRYTPAQENTRPPIEAKVAFLENNQIMQGEQVPVLPSELHAVQLPVHLGKLQELVQQADQGQIDLAQAAQVLVGLFQHASQHLEFMLGDPSAAGFKQQLQQAGEVVNNAIKAAQKLQRQQMEEQAVPQQGGQLDLSLEQKVVEAQAKLRYAEEKHAQEMRLREEQARQAMALKDAETAATIARKSVQ